MSVNFSALAIDPGKTTGFCLAQQDGNKLFLASFEKEWEVWDIYKYLLEARPGYVICEGFRYRPGQAKPHIVLFPVEVIGVVRLYCHISTTSLFQQDASQGKAFYTDDKLHQLGIYNMHTKHGRDAMRHFLHWFKFGAGFQFNDEPMLERVPRHYIEEAYLRVR